MATRQHSSRENSMGEGPEAKYVFHLGNSEGEARMYGRGSGCNDISKVDRA